jgi:transcriptional regulator with XRE-family HTH domain
MYIVDPLLPRVARAVPEARLEHRISQRRLAELAGVSPTTISRLEGGKRVRPGLLVRIASAVFVLDVYRSQCSEDARQHVLIGPQSWDDIALEEWAS